MRIWLETYGCSLNKFDSYIIRYYLISEGFSISDSIDKADIIIVNSCGVKKQTEDRIISRLKKLRALYKDKKLLLVGCLPLINLRRIKNETSVDGILGPSPGYKVVEAIEKIINGEYIEDLSQSSLLYKPIFSPDKIVSIPIGISVGCLDKCSFCGTRLARGNLKSYPPDYIIKLITNHVKHGVREFYLTSQDTGAYGFDLKPRLNIISLLKMIDSLEENNFIVRIGMMNPRWVYKFIDDLIEIFRSSTKFYHFLHIPVQSGSDKVLKIMNRGHGVEEYIESVRKLRKEVGKHFTIMTDIIVGHPGEDEEDFEATVEIVKESQPDYINISQFFPRPNTPSAFMKKIPTNIVKYRSTILSQVSDEVLYKRNMLWVGWKGAILLNEFGRRGDRILGRNYAYKIFAVDRDDLNIGDIIHIKAVKAYTTWLYGEYRKKSSSFLDLWIHSYSKSYIAY